MILMSDMDLIGRRVLIREDFNVPIENGVITSDARIRAAIPTIQLALAAGAAVILMSHLGRPKEGVYEDALSLEPVAAHLKNLLGHEVRFIVEFEEALKIGPGEIALLENVRFNPGEKANENVLALRYASLCDVFVMDAFGTAHRAEASTEGVAKYAPIACAGPLVAAEVQALSRAMDTPKHPVLAIVGGSKVSTKFSVLKHLVETVDTLIVGGGIANTFLVAAGHAVGKSLYEPDWVAEAAQLMKMCQSKGVKLLLPVDVVTAQEFSKTAVARVCTLDAVAEHELILDVGPETADLYAKAIQAAATIIWNGPVGVFEMEQFAAGTRALATAIANSSAYVLAGGGDTVAAIEKYHLEDKISYISTGGGAFLEFLEGRRLPALAILEARAQAV